MIEVNTLKLKSFSYDVARDGGAFGSINTGLFLAGRSFAGFFFGFKPVQPFVRIGAAQLSVGTPSNPAAFLPGTDLTALALAAWTGGNSFYTVLDPGEEVILNINVGAYITGRLIFSIITIESAE